MNALMKLSNIDLENSLGKHIDNERMSLDQIYQHINEVFRRELHLDSAYGDMRTYLIKRWKCSERDAYRKIEGARLLRDVPGLTAEIKNGNVNADVIGELARAVKEKERASHQKMTPAQKSELLQLVVGKTAAESQRELAQALDIQVKKFETKRVQRDNSVRLELSLSEEIYAGLMNCRDHASHKIRQDHLPHTLESLLKVLSEFYIKGHKLNESEKMKDASNFTMKTDQTTKSGEPVTKEVRINKTITPNIRRQVFQRDKCCQFRSPSTGQICGSKFLPQVDHKTSLWAGGTNELSNLQQLCAHHNQRKYRKESQLSWL